MFSKSVISAIIFAMLALAVLSAPAKPTARQGVPLTLPIETPTTMETDPVESPADMFEDAPAPPTMETPITVTLSEIPVPSMEEEEPAASGEPIVEFAYNIGGDEYGMFAADPVEWVVGETSFFEMADAEIVGDTENTEIYKSHRYGLLGLTWGYDIPVAQPGVYDCTLFYAETYSEYFTAEPNRTFIVEIAGDGAEEVQSEELDVMVELEGAEFTAYQHSFSKIAVATTLRLRETPKKGDAFLSGIHCMYVAPLAM